MNSKYTQEQLADMATEFIACRAVNDARCDALLTKLAERTGKGRAECEMYIHHIAMGFNVA